ncbi:hypothetical protein J7G17_001880 [Vibrio parahaemolyticus]|nr:hypothetical protein [Vibrio parahaemolyticus]
MEYFYITCSVASLVALLGYIRDKIATDQDHGFAYRLIGLFVFGTAIFWTWFYFAPENVVINKIEERFYSVQNFKNINEAAPLSVVEGKFNAYSFNEEVVVFLPSFAEPPRIFVKRADNIDSFVDPSPDPIEIFNITTDSFSYRAHGSDQHGDWIYRARGKLLERLE